MPLHRRIPKRGFTNPFRKEYAVVNLSDLTDLEGEITLERLLQEGIVKKPLQGLKVLGGGEVSKALTVKAHRFSRSALEKITRAGGRAEVLVPSVPARGPERT